LREEVLSLPSWRRGTECMVHFVGRDDDERRRGERIMVEVVIKR
jgi:hypothetical protein